MVEAILVSPIGYGEALCPVEDVNAAIFFRILMYHLYSLKGNIIWLFGFGWIQAGLLTTWVIHPVVFALPQE